MQRLVCDALWKTIKALARNNSHRQAAVAYVTSDELVKFRKGDVLVVDASDRRIKSGDTSAEVLAAAYRKGAHIFSLPNLHAKVLVFGRTAVVGSANISASSTTLVEAAVITEDMATVAQAKALIDQLSGCADEIDQPFIDRIQDLPVTKRIAHSPKGHVKKPKVRLTGGRTWMVNVTELRDNAYPDEAEYVKVGEKIAKERLSTRRHDVSWIRWTGSQRFRAEAGEGDLVIQIWHGYRKKRRIVYRPAPILHRQDKGHWTRFYLEDPAEDDSSMPFGAFQKLVRKLGMPGRVGPSSCREIPPGFGTVLDLLWAKQEL